MSNNDYPPLKQDTQIITDISGPIAKDWLPETLPERKHGVRGVITHYHDSHGLVYGVRHEDGTHAHYEPHELIVINYSDIRNYF